MSYGKIFKNGTLTQNPTFVQVIGMCPTLAVTTTAFNGLGMGLATTLTIFITSFIISCLKAMIPEKAKIPAMIVIIASTVSVIIMIIQAYLPALNDALGIFLPLIVVNCLVLGRGEAFAFKNKPIPSAIDGLSMGLGFTLGLTLLSSVREIIGSGTFLAGTDFMITLPEAFPRTLIFVLPPGAFIALGLLMVLVRKIGMLNKERAERAKILASGAPSVEVPA